MIWPTKKLGEVTKEIIGGGTPRRNNLEYWNGDIPWMTVDDINGNFYILKTKQFISKKGLENSNAKLVPSNSVILSCTASVGNVAINKIPLTTNQQFNSFVCNNEIIPEFLAYILILKKRIIESLGGVTTFPFISKSIITKLKIPLPPLKIQKQIIERLDKIAEAQKLNDGLIKKTDELFQSLLHKELNPVGPAVAKAVAGKKDWDVKKLGDIAEVTSSKRIYQSEYVEDGVPFYRTKEIVELSQDKPISLELFISQKRYDEIKSKFGVPEKRDILISAVGTIGISWIVSDDRNFYFKDGNLLWIKNMRGIDPAYLKVVLDNFAKKISQMGAGGAYNALTIIKLKKLQISVPPIKQQKQIVAKLSAVQDYKKQLLEQKTKLKELFDSSLAKSMTSEKKSKDA